MTRNLFYNCVLFARQSRASENEEAVKYVLYMQKCNFVRGEKTDEEI